MPTLLTEDDLYRTSSQYRLWSFSPESLSAVRQKTHALGLERARGIHDGAPANGDLATPTDNGTTTTSLEYLTAEEELRLVQRYSDQIRTTSDHFKWPVNVKATAVQFLRRFYLSNSCITYPPKEIYKTVLFLACKSEATHMPLGEYARRISTQPDIILAPEYKVMQALRFTLDVRQPYRGLKAVLMELLNMADGKVGEVSGQDEELVSNVGEQMLALENPHRDSSRTPWNPPAAGTTLQQKHLQDRINAAYAAAKGLLDGAALMTDAYFLYTPSQILIAALHVADEPLASFYLGTKLPISSDARPKILATIRTCAELLASYSDGEIMTKEDRNALEEKLEKCRDPTARDLVKANAAAKRGNDEDEGEKARKRKLAREKELKEGDDLFGPSLSNATSGAKG